MLNEPRRGGQSTGRRWSAKHGTPAKCMVGQQPRRGGRMTTTYTSYHCSATPSGLLISNHHQAGVTLRSTTCLWSSQPFGLHFTISCYTRQVQILQVGCSSYNLFFPMVQGIKNVGVSVKKKKHTIFYYKSSNFAHHVKNSTFADKGKRGVKRF